MKTALVTGSAGFIGRHMAHALGAAGYRVGGIDIAYARGPQDALDYFRTADYRVDVIVHAAAAGADRASIDRTPLVLAANLELDAALFRWAARTRPGRVVYLSSSAAYPVCLQVHLAVGGLRMSEEDIDLDAPEQPDQLYGWAKLTGERLAVLARAAGVPVTVVRPFSGYGEDQGERFPFGALAARAARRESPFTIWGSGHQVRDFIHVDDITAAILTMITEGIDGPVNLGTGRATSMRDLAGLMCAAAGYQPEFRPLPDRPSGVAYRVADITRMSEFFTPKISLEEGVARAVGRG